MAQPTPVSASRSMLHHTLTWALTLLVCSWSALFVSYIFAVYLFQPPARYLLAELATSHMS